MKTETRNAGQIPKIWLENIYMTIADAPRALVDDWFMSASNHALKISEDRTVWNADTGAWLTQDRIDQLCKRIDQGV